MSALDLENCLGLVSHTRAALIDALTAIGTEGKNGSAALACSEALANVTALEGELESMRAEGESEQRDESKVLS